jgi:hypothetical protein
MSPGSPVASKKFLSIDETVAKSPTASLPKN